MALHSIDAILIENGINCLAIGLPEPIGVQQLEYHEGLEYLGIDTLTDKQRVIDNAVLESVDKKRRDFLIDSCIPVSICIVRSRFLSNTEQRTQFEGRNLKLLIFSQICQPICYIQEKKSLRS
ncbi:Hypothetical predicted protein [Octopus vulgaris]|uniref:Uncharacterized protein n=1 Tax=Octopus vulgaris TaxID=6645 RepID=A0AA36B0X2_OCTVU|nr:Hypothetical predicted protein [Octopus vulgaris]